MALAEALGGTAVAVDDARRSSYHAAASIAANHLVALIGQVERVAASAGLPLEAFAGLMRAATDDALALGPRLALTGPASRGDWETVERHRVALSVMAGHRAELAAYDAMVGLARRLSMEAAPAGVDRSAPLAMEDGRSTAPRVGAGGMSTVLSPATPPEQVAPSTPSGPWLRRWSGPWPSIRRPSMPSAARADRSAWSPPWARCTRATGPWSSGPPASATWWPCPSS